MGRITYQERQLFNALHKDRANDNKVLQKRQYKGLIQSVIDKYPDTAHFIYELLQNADDAFATEVYFTLRPNSLLFKHNGTKHFNLTPPDEEPQGDINAITGIGFSNKQNDFNTQNKIGKFGLGFKSVLQYTDTPEIYDDIFKFKIEDMIVPTLLEYDHPERKEGETLFVLPFKTDKVQQCFKEIKERLEQLRNPLLFLNHLKKIIWRIDYTEQNKGKEYIYTKDLTETIAFDDITLQRYNLKEPIQERHIFLFSRNIEIEGMRHRIYIGFFYDIAQKRLITDEIQNIYCFFPTIESFKACFISHAPFLLTDNRQNLKPSEQVNHDLLGALATLATDSIICLRDYGIASGQLLIDENIVDILPKTEYYYYYDTGYHLENYIIKACKYLLQSEAILLSRNGRYLRVEDAYTSTTAIYRLLTQEQFVTLRSIEENEDDDYDDEDRERRQIITDKVNNPDIDFLKWELRMRIFSMNKKNEDSIYHGVADYSVEDFANDITADFMSRQTSKWVITFYTFLRYDAPIFWKMSPQNKTTIHVFRRAPIIKTQKGKWVKPYINITTSNVFLPLNSEQTSNSEYNFIHDEFMQDELACKFFEELEIKKPDEYNYIYSVILNRYRYEGINTDGLIEDFIILVQYYIKLRNDVQKLNEYIDTLKKDLFLRVFDTDSFEKANKLYFQNSMLKCYFQDNENVHFLDDKYYNKIKMQFGNAIYNSFFEALGVAKYPRIENTHMSNYQLLQITQIKNCSSINLESDYHIEGFSSLCDVQGIDKELSVYIWNEVFPLIDLNKYKEMTVKYKLKYARHFCSATFDSSIIRDFKEKRWIYNKYGELCTANEVIQEDLVEEYDQYNGLVQLLNIEKKQRDLTKYGATDEEQKNFELGSRLKQEMGNEVSDEELIEWLRELKARKLSEKAAQQEATKRQEQQSTTESTDLFVNGQPTTPPKNIDEKLSKKWEEKKNRHIGRPHSSTANQNEIPFDNCQGVESPDNTAPFFAQSLSIPQNSDVDDTKRAEKNLKAKDTTAQSQAEIAKDMVDILDLLKQTPEYTFKWFKVLMELMHAGQEKITERRVQIDFSRYELTCSDKILHLTEPTLPVPAWICDAEKYSITVLADGKTAKIDGLIVKTSDDSIDVSIEVNNKMLTDLQKAKKIRVVGIDNTNIIDSLETRFLQLEKEDDFDMNANLPKNIEFIYGPPGTGKTTRLVERVHNLLEQEPNAKILVLTPTNKAADVVAVKMSDDEVCEESLARYGSTESLYLIEEIGCVTNRDTTDMSWHNVVVATAARYAYDYLQPDDTAICDYPWDYIFIDEASMIDILTITYILYKGANAKHIIISGDPKQIQPVVQNDMPAYNIYNMVGLQGFANAIFDYTRYPVEGLMMQHRSIPVIGNMVSQFAYDGLVDCDPNRAPMKPLTLDGITTKNVNFVGFDVAELDDIRGLIEVNKSAFNLYSVIFTYNMVEYTIKQIEKHYPNQDYTIGIVCAYRAQSDAIKNMLENRPLDSAYCKVTCGTVHSFQGDECDIMFIVLNPPAVCTSGAHVNNENIINVAMSRARDYLFFIMPNGQPKGFYMKHRIGAVVSSMDRTILNCRNIERVMFHGNENFIYEHTHVTCHMPVNVYCEDNALYEVRISDTALDIKINQH